MMTEKRMEENRKLGVKKRSALACIRQLKEKDLEKLKTLAPVRNYLEYAKRFYEKRYGKQVDEKALLLDLVKHAERKGFVPKRVSYFENLERKEEEKKIDFQGLIKELIKEMLKIKTELIENYLNETEEVRKQIVKVEKEILTKELEKAKIEVSKTVMEIKEKLVSLEERLEELEERVGKIDLKGLLLNEKTRLFALAEIEEVAGQDEKFLKALEDLTVRSKLRLLARGLTKRKE